MNVYIIGIGLIGGSFALDLRLSYPKSNFFGIDIDSENIKDALNLGIIDEVADIKDIYSADIVILSTPVNISVNLICDVLDLINDNCLVFDVGSTKSPICDIVNNHAKRHQFIAVHPIAGTEFSGAKSAKTGLFNGKTNIICQIERTGFVFQEKALNIFKSIGMRIRYMTPDSHDKHIAYMSHLSHISSFMLGKTVIEKERDERDVFDMAGSGFESTVRLAKSSPDMWTPIFMQNKDNVIQALDEYINNLTLFKDLLISDNHNSMHKEMNDTNRIKKILS